MLEVMSLTVAAMVGSVFIMSSIFFIEDMTVEWFLSSNSAPISLSERFVSVRIRYIAICLAIAVFFERFCPRRSSSVREYYSALSRIISCGEGINVPMRTTSFIARLTACVSILLSSISLYAVRRFITPSICLTLVVIVSAI